MNPSFNSPGKNSDIILIMKRKHISDAEVNPQGSPVGNIVKNIEHRQKMGREGGKECGVWEALQHQGRESGTSRTQTHPIVLSYLFASSFSPKTVSGQENKISMGGLFQTVLSHLLNRIISAKSPNSMLSQSRYRKILPRIKGTWTVIWKTIF